MLYVKNGDEYKYNYSEKKFRLAFEFLKRKDLADLEPGKYQIGEGVYANVLHYNSKAWEDAKWEAHDRYFDIQYIVKGREYMGLCERALLTEFLTPYNSEKDVIHFKDPADYGKVVLNAGDFIVLAPEDGHKPSVSVRESLPNIKVVVKVPV